MVNFSITKATKKDVPAILQFIKELAEYQKIAHEVITTEEILAESLFGEEKCAEVIFTEIEGIKVGFCLFFQTFSTFLGRPGIYIEDIYVKSEYRGQGIGKKFFIYLAKLAKDRHYGRIEWACLDWNDKAINFYKSLGAKPMEDWTTFRLIPSDLII